tara:strand:- start:429 stop:1391 length:963 start_codon:yes stop_codon:yes gene_type:complete
MGGSITTEILQSGADGQAQFAVVTSVPNSASDFTISGVDYNILYDKTGDDGEVIYGLNSDSTRINKWEGSLHKALTFNLSGFSLQNSSGSVIATYTSYEIGSSSQVWQSATQGFTCSYNNVSGGTLSGTNQITGTNLSASQTFVSSALSIVTGDLTGAAPSQAISDFTDGASNTDIYHTNDSTWSSGKKTIGFNLTANDGSATQTASLTFNFYNRKFWGGSSNSTLTSSQIIALANTPFVTSTLALSSTTATTSGTQYLFYCFPTRYSQTPTFFVNGFDTTFTQLSNVSVTNSSGYQEDYEVWRSPQQYTNASFPFEVTV